MLLPYCGRPSGIRIIVYISRRYSMIPVLSHHFFDCCSTMGLWLDDCVWWFPEMVVPLDHPLIDGISWKNKPSSYGATPMYGTPYIVVENSFPTFAQPWLYLGFYPWLYLNCTPPSRKLSINCVHMFHSFVDLLQRNRGTWKSHAPRMPSPGRPGQFHHWNWGVNWLLKKRRGLVAGCLDLPNRCCTVSYCWGFSSGNHPNSPPAHCSQELVVWCLRSFQKTSAACMRHEHFSRKPVEIVEIAWGIQPTSINYRSIVDTWAKTVVV